MATTVTDANLRITITDKVTINGQKYGNTNTITMVVKLDAGKSFLLGGVSFDADNADIAQGAVAHNSAFVISAEATVAACDVEVFVASV